MFSSFLGLDYKQPAQNQDRNRLLQQLQDPNYGQQQLQASTQAAVQNALPSFMQNLQSTREDNIRRGTSTGDLGTSFENDLTSAFQRNIANSVAGQQSNLLQQRTNSLLGAYGDDLDREQGAQNDAAQRKSGFIGGLLDIGGGAVGGGLKKVGHFLGGLF